MESQLITGLLVASVGMATPLALAAIGGLLSERSGVLNIALEGMMLTGAFGGFIGSYLSGNVWVGVLCAMATGGLVGLLHAFMSISLYADQIVSGAAINILSVGLTSFLAQVTIGIKQVPTVVTAFKPIAIPILSKIPYVGPILFNHTPFTYSVYILAPALAWGLFRTRWGLELRAVGEHPAAADTVAINVKRYRYVAVTLSGVLAGLGGAFLSLGHLNVFMDSMTAGRGFIAYAAMVFGRWNPLGVALASLVFGAADALQLRLQGLGFEIPYQLPVMLPYVVTLLFLALFAGRAAYPAAAGKPYTRE